MSRMTAHDPEYAVSLSRTLVSVVIPMYNSETTIARALESALSQEPQPLEVIVVDDGSTDGSARVVARYRDRVRYIFKENGGPGSARNAGMAAARGDLIAFLDADDYWLPGFLEATTAFLASEPSVGAVATSYLVESRVMKRRVLRPAPRLRELSTGVVADFFSTYSELPLVWTGAVVIRAAVARAAGPMRTDLPAGQDVEYWCRVATVAPWGFIAEPLAVYDRTSAVSVTRGPGCPRFVRDTDLWKRDIEARLDPNDLPGFGRLVAGLGRRAFGGFLAERNPRAARAVLRSGKMGIPRCAEWFCWTLTYLPGRLAWASSAAWQLSLRVWRAGRWVRRWAVGSGG